MQLKRLRSTDLLISGVFALRALWDHRPPTDPMRAVTEALRHVHTTNVRAISGFMADMDPTHFEWLVAAVFVRAGYTDVEVTPPSGDRGIDVKATAPGVVPIRVFIQAKRKPSVGSPTVTQLRGSCPSGYSGILVTSGTFTDEAYDEAADKTKHNQITLISGKEFAELLLDNGIGTRRIPLETHSLALDEITLPFLQEIVQVPAEATADATALRP